MNLNVETGSVGAFRIGIRYCLDACVFVLYLAARHSDVSRLSIEIC